MPSLVRCHRSGRRPLRSSAAPTTFHERLGRFPAPAHQQLKRVVEGSRVRSLWPDHAAQLRLELGFTSSHPGSVTGDGVDLAVVGQHPEGLRKAPVGHRVRRIALVEDRKPALASRVAQVEVEVSQPRAGHQALVDDGPARAGGQIHAHARLRRSLLRQASRQVQPVLPLVGVEVGAGDQAVPDVGHRGLGPLSQALDIHRHRAPREQPQAGAGNRFGDDRPGLLVPLEQDRQGEVVSDQAVRHLDQEARAVTALAVRVEAAAMGEAGQGLDAQGHGFVAQLGRGHEPHPARGPAVGHLPRPGMARLRLKGPPQIHAPCSEFAGPNVGGTEMQATVNRRFELVRC